MRSLIIPAVILMLLIGCSGQPETPSAETSATGVGESGGLSADELENGIGPVKQLELGAVDATLAAKGQVVFDTKCLSCHHIADRFIGPPLADVLSRRTPRYVMNMILNPEEMVKRHPVAKQLLAEYLAPMAQQNLTQDEARAVLEYIRSSAAAGDATQAAK